MVPIAKPIWPAQSAVRAILVLAAAGGTLLDLVGPAPLAAQEPSPNKPVQKADATPSDAATRRFAAATALENREQFDQAADEWTSFLKDYPDDSRADRSKFHFGFCRLKTKRYADASQAFQRVIADHPRSALLASAWFHLGLTHYNRATDDGAANDGGTPYTAAADAFATLLEKFPQAKEAARAMFYRAESLYALDHKAEAAALYDDFIRLHGSDDLLPAAWYGLGVAREELGEAAAAAEAYEHYLNKTPNGARAGEVLMRWGRLLFDRREFAAAAKQFAAAAERPDFAAADLATLRQAAALEALGDYVTATKLLAGFAARYPDSSQKAAAELAVGRVAYLAGQHEAALAALTAVIKTGGSEAAEAAHWLARLQLFKNEAGEALKTVDAALPDAAGFTSALRLDRADALFAIEARRREAIAAYAALADEQPTDPLAPRALYLAAYCALDVGELAQAQQYAAQFEKGFADDPLLPDALDVAAESDLRLGHHEAAAELYSRLIERHAAHAFAARWAVRRGLALFLGKKYDETIAALEPQVASLSDRRLKAEARYLLGRSQLELRQFAAASTALAAALADDPASPRADDLLFALAGAERQLNRGPSAAEHLRQLIQRFPQSPLVGQARLSLAEVAYARGAFDEAASEYARLVETLPDSPLVPDATTGLAWTQLARKDFTTAAATLDALLERYPTGNWTPRARFARGLARERLKQFEAASEDLRAFLESGAMGRDRSDARYALGLCQSRLEQYGPAAGTFRELLNDDPSYVGADNVLRELATAQEMDDELDAAVTTLRRLAKEHPASALAAEALLHAGELEQEQDRPREAAICFDAAMRKAGKTPLAEKAAYLLGHAWFDQGEFEKARQTFTYQRAQFPRGALADDAAFMQGEALLAQGKYAAAVAEYAKVRRPAEAELAVLALLHSARADARQKRFGASLATLERAVRQFPKSEHFAELLVEQAWDTQNMGRLDAATALYERVAGLAGDELAARARFMVGDILAAKQQYRPAIENFTKAAYGYSAPEWQALAYYEAGRCHEALGEPADARKMYQELLDQFPEGERAGEARERLKALDGQAAVAR
jgi:cellulose synthase operon protein C